jgi:hypothetical protein
MSTHLEMRVFMLDLLSEDFHCPVSPGASFAELRDLNRMMRWEAARVEFMRLLCQGTWDDGGRVNMAASKGKEFFDTHRVCSTVESSREMSQSSEMVATVGRI